MSSATRRTFFKAGISAGAVGAARIVFPGRCVAGTKSVSAPFSLPGLTGTVRLNLAGEAPDDSSFAITVDTAADGTARAHMSFDPRRKLAVERFSVEVAVPLRDVNRIWYTQQLDGLGQHVYISLPWGADIPASGHQGSFIAMVQNRFGRNRGLVAFRNQTGDGSLEYRIEYGGEYFRMTLNRFAQGRTFSADAIDETLYIDLGDIPWQTVVSRFTEWYDSEWGLSYDTPEHCYEPVFNTWYPIKEEQRAETIERYAKTCREIGIKTFEIDAGWFKSTGTWELDTVKIPDLRALVRKIRAMGMRVIIWYNPFDFGAAKGLEHLETVVDRKPTGKFCPRCREVQERAARIAGELMERYDLDGLKIDFLDASPGAAPLVNCEAGHAHSHDFVSDGVREAMRLMALTIRKQKPDAIIEYRLNYSNVANRQFATIYRGQDAPSDIDLVRRHLTLIRSWCRGVAPHADYAYWTPGESDENVSRFMAVISLYGVPTLSVDFDALPETHLSIIKAWLSFYHRNKRNLIDGRFEPLSDDFHYSVARVSAKGSTYIPCFLREWPSAIPLLSGSSDTVVLVNGSSRPSILTRLEGAGSACRMTVTDRMLRPLADPVAVKGSGGFLTIDSPVDIGGMVKIERI